MYTKEIKEKATWENFCLECTNKTFTHSFNWGIFNELMGEKVFRFGIYDQNQILISVFQLIKTTARRGTFLLLPMGPLMINEDHKKEILKEVLKITSDLAKKEKADFIRFAPILIKSKENEDLFKELKFKQAPMHIHPELTWEIDLKNKTEENLLSEMRKNTRYYVRQAGKNEDIEIIKSTDLKDVKAFEDVYKITAERHNFTPFSPKYLENELKAFRDDNEVLVFVAKYKGEILASSMIIFWSNGAYYHQGASSQKYPKIPTSYLLQWEGIKEAKKRGCETYNFWGIAREEEIKNKNHPWAGLTLFKKGFGGAEKEYVKTQDYPITFKYNLIRLFELARKSKRNL